MIKIWKSCKQVVNKIFEQVVKKMPLTFIVLLIKDVAPWSALTSVVSNKMSWRYDFERKCSLTRVNSDRRWTFLSDLSWLIHCNADSKTFQKQIKLTKRFINFFLFQFFSAHLKIGFQNLRYSTLYILKRLVVCVYWLEWLYEILYAFPYSQYIYSQGFWRENPSRQTKKTYFETMERFLGYRKNLYFFFKSIVLNMKRSLNCYIIIIAYSYTITNYPATVCQLK